MPSHKSIVIFSGGTAANHLVDIFESIRRSKDCPISYIIPISDNGGSSSELIRVFGGPGIGDVRSRLVRLIPRLPQGSPGFKEREAIRGLFNHRLSSTDSRTAKMQWADVVDGTSDLWHNISSAKKELIRSFFNLVSAEITKRSRPPNSTFDFTSASVGNLFLTGARLFSGSFESAIYLLGSVCGIEDENTKIIPSINSNFSHHIAAGLEDGTVIVGQNAISHPSPEAVAPVIRGVNGQTMTEDGPQPNENLARRPSGMDHYYGDEFDAEREQEQEEEDANLPGTLPTLRTKNINFNKDAHLNEELPARISRIWYINPYGQEILPPANPRAIQAINNAQAVIYSIGSLYTSLLPSLVLRGVGDALRKNTSAAGTGLRTKILILNGCLDREVGPQPPHPGSRGTMFSAVDFIEAIVRAGEQSRGVAWDSDSTDNIWSGTNTPDNITATAETHRTTNVPPFPKPRPGLPSSKSESILRTTLRSFNVAPPRHQHSQFFPSPLPASELPSREPSPLPSPLPQPHNPPLTIPEPEPTTLRSNSTIDALKSLPQTQNQAQKQQSQSQPQPHTVNKPSSQPPSRPTTPFPSTSHNPNPIYTHYITHLIHLPNSASTPYVNKDVLLSKHGIKCIRVYGRTAPDGQGMTYDPADLRHAIEAIIGRRAERENGGEIDDDDGDDRDEEGMDRGDSRRGGRGRRRRGSRVEKATTVPGQEWSWKIRGMPRRNTLDG